LVALEDAVCSCGFIPLVRDNAVLPLPAVFQPDDELSLLDSTIVDGFHALLFSWLDMVWRY